MAPSNLPLPQAGAAEVIADVQKRPSPRTIDIDKVGVKNISYPIVVLDKFNGTQHTVARINMYVNLPHRHKGTHMSRFIEILSECRRDISIRNIEAILEETRKRLHAQIAHIEMTFPYFIDKAAPVSRARGLMEYICTFNGALDENSQIDLVVGITVPITTLCPCSKEISQVGAHNQRGEVRVQVRYQRFFWIEDLIRHGGGVGLLRGLRPAEAPGREIRHREGLHQPHVRGRRGPGDRPPTQKRPTTSPGTRWSRKTSSPSTTTPPTPTSNRSKIPRPRSRAAALASAASTVLAKPPARLPSRQSSP